MGCSGLPDIGLMGYRAARNCRILVFLVKVSGEKVDHIIAELDKGPEADVDGTVIDETEFLVVPWIRDTVPPPNAIFKIASQSTFPSGFIFVDQESLSSETAVITHPSVPSGEIASPQAARVPLREATGHLTAADRSSLSQVVPNFEACKVVRRPEVELDTIDETWQPVLPAHLPSDLKLEASTLVLVCLSHLQDQEIVDLKAEIDPIAEASIVVYNWPANSQQASQADLYHIFQCIKPSYSDGIDQTFVMFVDVEELVEAKRQVYVLLVEQERVLSSDGQPYSERKLKLDNSILLSKVPTKEALHVWQMIWNPAPSTATWDGLHVNEPLRKAQDRNRIERLDVIANPEKLVICGEYIVFFVNHTSEKTIRCIRSKMMEAHSPGSNHDRYQFIHSHTLNGGTMRSLLEFFESPSFKSYAKHPGVFLVVDGQTVVEVEDSDPPGDDFSLLLAETSHFDYTDDEDCIFASEDTGYEYGRILAHQAHGALQNLLIANMDVEEFLGVGQRAAYWPSCKTFMKEES